MRYIADMQWTVETLGPVVDAELAALPQSLRARLVRLTETIEAVGLDKMREPHVKHVEGKLWELRAKSPEGIARGFYVTASGRRIVILHVFAKKSQRTPLNVLKTARERMKQVKP